MERIQSYTTESMENEMANIDKWEKEELKEEKKEKSKKDGSI